MAIQHLLRELTPYGYTTVTEGNILPMVIQHLLRETVLMAIQKYNC